MKHKYYLFLIMILFLILPNFVEAEDCTKEEIETLKEQANAIRVDSEFDYDAVKNGIFGRYQIKVYGLPKDFYIKTKEYGIIFDNSMNVGDYIYNEIGTKDGILEVYDKRCSSTILRTINLKLKYYNVFANEKECQETKSANLDVCQEFTEKEVTYEEIKKEIDKYKKNNKQEKEEKKEKNFITKNLTFIIIGALIIIITITVISILNWRKKYRLD